MISGSREILTPEQAADYLQVNRETIYRYIRQRKLAASKLGRSYRISRRNLNLLLLATQTQSNIPVREYSDEEIARFLERDKLSPEAERVVRQFEDRSPYVSADRR
jgi:excisionase family DNA binding protein